MAFALTRYSACTRSFKALAAVSNEKPRDSRALESDWSSSEKRQTMKAACKQKLNPTQHCNDVTNPVSAESIEEYRSLCAMSYANQR